MKSAALLTFLLAPLSLIASDSSTPAAKRPNFLFILVDDQSPFDFKFYR